MMFLLYRYNKYKLMGQVNPNNPPVFKPQEAQTYIEMCNQRALELYKDNPKAIELLKYFSQILLEQLKTSHIAVLMEKRLFPWHYQIKIFTMDPICAKLMNNNKSFQCYDCTKEGQPIYCYQCFTNTNHEGHRFVQLNSTGMCDCGQQDKLHTHCPLHSQQQPHQHPPLSLENNIQAPFTSEIKLSFFLLFHLIECQISYGLTKLKKVYQKVLINNLKVLLAFTYDFKLLTGRVLMSKFDQFLTNINKDYSILEHYFKMDLHHEIQVIQPILFMLYPVVQFKNELLKQYINKSNYDLFQIDHPIKKISFQYFTHINLTPLHSDLQHNIPPLLPNLSPQHKHNTLQNIYHRYLDDCLCLLVGRSVRYWSFHFQKSNINKMIQYSRFAIFGVNKMLLDKFFLPIFIQIGKTLLKEKTILRKCIEQLFVQISTKTVKNYSLIQQRVVAIFVLIYFDGDLQKISEQDQLLLLDMLNCPRGKRNEKIRHQMKRMLTVCLDLKFYKLTIAQNNNKNDINTLNSGHIIRFQQEFADILYLKILLLFNRGQNNYCQLIEEMSYQLEKSNYNNIVQRLNCLLYLVNMALSFQLDELILFNYYQFPGKQQIIMEFYSRAIDTFWYSNLRMAIDAIRQFTKQNQLFKKFFTEKVTLQNNKFVNNQKLKPLEYFQYNEILSPYGLGFNKKSLAMIDTSLTLQRFKGFTFFNKVALNKWIQIVKKRRNISQKLEIEEKEFKNQQKFYIELLKMYFMAEDLDLKRQIKDNIKDFLSNVGRKCGKEIKLQLQIIFDTEQLANEPKVGVKLVKNEKEVKRQMLQRKKLSAKATIEKNKDMAFKKYDIQKLGSDDIQQNKDQYEHEQCVYCKQVNNQEPLFLLSFCNITNLFQDSILHIDSFHAFFKSCGHKIHQKCYEKYLTQKSEFRQCLLCKTKINLIIPQFSNDQILQETRLLNIKETLNKIYMFLLQQNVNQQQRLQKFNKDLNQEPLNIVIESIVLELIFKSKFNYKGLYRHSFVVYRELIELVKNWTSESVESSLNFIQKRWEKYHQVKQQMASLKPFCNYLKQRLVDKKQHKDVMKNYHTIQDLTRMYSLLQANNLNQIYNHQLQNKQMAIDKRIMRYDFPKTLDAFQYEKRCPFCKQFTIILIKCLLCQHVCCLANNCLNRHAKRPLHYNGQIYAFFQTGRVSLLGRIQKNFSIYLNMFGEPYMMNSLQHARQKQAFSLNSQKLLELYYILLQYDISNHSQP